MTILPLGATSLRDKISTIQNTVKYLQPKYLHTGHDELTAIIACPRYRKCNMTTVPIVSTDCWEHNEVFLGLCLN